MIFTGFSLQKLGGGGGPFSSPSASYAKHMLIECLCTTGNWRLTNSASRGSDDELKGYKHWQ